jgi:hypothetical protein
MTYLETQRYVNMEKNDPENLSLDFGPAPEATDPVDDLSCGPWPVHDGKDPRGAVVHFDRRTRTWRANNWAGPLSRDGFASREAAEAAIRKAPPRPKPEKELKVRKLSPGTRAEGLTCRDEQRRVFDAKGQRIGGVIPVAEGYTAWSNTRGKLGVYSADAEAEAAVRAALRPK